MKDRYTFPEAEPRESSRVQRFLAGAALRGTIATPLVLGADKLSERVGGDFISDPKYGAAMIAALAVTGGIQRLKLK